MACKGVDLTHPEWILACVVVAPPDSKRRLIPPDNTPPSEWPIEMIRDGQRPLWKEIEKKLVLSSLQTEIPDVPLKLINPFLDNERRQSSIDQKVFGNENVEDLCLSVAFPYQTSPLVRKCIHKLFNPQTLNKNKRENRTAIEAPIALALECVAQSRIDIQSRTQVLLLTGVDPSIEVTAATLQQVDSLLKIDITAFASLDAEGVSGDLRRFGRKRATCLFHAGTPDVAQKVAKELQLDPDPDHVVDLGKHAVAIGAVRHGGLLRSQFWLENKINKLEVVRSAPVAVGVLGTNEAGDWFWRRISDKDIAVSTSATKAGLRIGGPPPERLGLAECPRPDFAGRRWLAQDDWSAAGLRWHDIVSPSETPDTWDLQLKIGQNRNWHKFSLPSWEIGQPDPETPEPLKNEQSESGGA